jgi:hypothetical protein
MGLTARETDIMIPAGARRFLMSESRKIENESSLVIQEIENQLEKLLAKRKNEIDSELAARIREEEEAARARMEGVKKDIDRERETLREFQAEVVEAERERETVLDGIREGFSKVLDLQSQIEALVKRTVEEITRIGDLQQKLESLRRMTSERAAFLKKDLKERFGVVAEAPGEEELLPEPAPDLDAELEKLRRIRTLLSGMESRLEPEKAPGQRSEDDWQGRIPEIQELIQATRPHEEARPESPLPAGGAEEPFNVLERLRRIEPVAGSGEISYFHGEDKAVLDAGRLLDALDRAVDVAWKLTGKLEGTESPRDRFFIKQELINGQEALRNLVLRAAGQTDIGSLGLPAETLDIVDVPILRGLADRLSTGNWANANDLSAFAGEIKKLRAAFLERTTPPDRYVLSILDALGGSGSVERPCLP